MSHIGQNLEIPVTVSVGEINLTTDDLQNPKNPPEVLLHQPSGGLTGTGGLRGHSHYFTVWHHVLLHSASFGDNYLALEI